MRSVDAGQRALSAAKRLCMICPIACLVMNTASLKTPTSNDSGQLEALIH
jgi:hypothetical protein